MAKTQSYIRLTGQAVLWAISVFLLAVLWLSLQTTPSVTATEPLSVDEVTRVEQTLVNNAPRDVGSPELQKLSLTSDELNLLIRYAGELLDTGDQINGRVELPGDELIADISIPLPYRYLPFFLNIRAAFYSDGRYLELASLKAGQLPIPGWLANNLAGQLERRYLGDNQTYTGVLELLESVRALKISENRVAMDFQWEPSLLSSIRNRAQQLLVSDLDQHRIARHFHNLTDYLDRVPETTRAITLTSLFKPMFAAARQQSMLDDDPVSENRTLLLTLAAYVNEEDIRLWLAPELADTLPDMRFIEVRVQQRQDLAQHIVSSAAISASAGAGLAHILSSIKENYDARYRSGFSFSDLTANEAGVILGTVATKSAAYATLVQERMMNLESDSDYFPAVDNNRDGLSESDFNARYRDSGSSQYQEKISQIEALIYQRPLFQGLENQ